MNNNDINLYNDKTYRSIDYASLKIGDEFYLRRPVLTGMGGFDVAAYKKMASLKINEHKWVNAKTKLGIETFIPYDKKVYVEVKS